jgi:hypothetical protein
MCQYTLWAAMGQMETSRFCLSQKRDGERKIVSIRPKNLNPPLNSATGCAKKNERNRAIRFFKGELS